MSMPTRLEDMKVPQRPSLPKAGGCSRLSTWAGLWRLDHIPLVAEAGEGLGSDSLQPGDEF